MVHGGGSGGGKGARRVTRAAALRYSRLPSVFAWRRPFPTDATRPRRYSADAARRKFYAQHRAARFARRQLGP
jgi:hypothetical protein